MARGARGRSERAMGGRVRDGCCGKGSREREREVRGLEWGVTRGGRERFGENVVTGQGRTPQPYVEYTPNHTHTHIHIHIHTHASGPRPPRPTQSLPVPLMWYELYEPVPVPLHQSPGGGHGEIRPPDTGVCAMCSYAPPTSTPHPPRPTSVVPSSCRMQRIAVG